MNNILFFKNNFLKILVVTILNVIVSNTCMCQEKLYVKGSLFGRPIETQVDHSFAATMLTNRQDISVTTLFAHYQDQKLCNELLTDITKNYSLDVASLFLYERLYEQNNNKQLQDFYSSTIDLLSSSKLDQELSFLQDYHIVFVPAFNYESNAGNFWQQRELLDSARISHEIIKTYQWGLVEENAQMIADCLQKTTHQHKNVIVVSVSKGGLETALALEKITNPDVLNSIKAWINVSGILKGSPAADHWLKPSKKIWLRFGLFFSGKWKVPLNQLLNNLSYEQRKQKADTLSIPQNIYTVNLIAGKLRTQKDRTELYLPSDGYSPLLDEIADNGDVVVEMSADHTYEGVDLNVRMVALLRYVTNKLQGELVDE